LRIDAHKNVFLSTVNCSAYQEDKVNGNTVLTDPTIYKAWSAKVLSFGT